MSHLVMREEDDSILDLKQIEDMMRASQSNMFSSMPLDSNIRSSANRESVVDVPQNMTLQNSTKGGAATIEPPSDRITAYPL